MGDGACLNQPSGLLIQDPAICRQNLGKINCVLVLTGTLTVFRCQQQVWRMDTRVDPALQVDGTFQNSKGANKLPGNGCQVRFFEFINIASRSFATKRNCLGKGIVRYGNCEFWYFFQGVPGITSRRHSNGQDWIAVVGRSDLSPAQRNQVGFVCFVDNRAKHAAPMESVQNFLCAGPEIQLFALCQTITTLPVDCSFMSLDCFISRL